MSNIGYHLKKIDDLKLDNYNHFFSDIKSELERLNNTEGGENELGKYAANAATITKNKGQAVKNSLNGTNSFNDNYFESTGMPCYTSLAGTSLVIPSGVTKSIYVMNNKIGHTSHTKNLVENSKLDLERKDPLYSHFYKFEKQFTIYNEPISKVEGSTKIKIGNHEAYSNSIWDNSIYTRAHGGDDWVRLPKSGQHKFKVLKSSPPYQWKIFHYDGVIENKDGSSEIDMVPPSNPDQDYNGSKTWNEGWKDKAKWLKFEYYNLREYETDKQLENRMAKLNLKKTNKRFGRLRAWFIIENIRTDTNIGNLNYELNNLFDIKTHKCEKISLPVRDRGGNCSPNYYISDTDYRYIQEKFPNLFNSCENRQISGFQNEYAKVKKQLGSGYIFVSGLLLLYLIHRLFNRK